MLVYLDTAHFSYLADTADPGMVRAFFQAWDRAECALAFSVPHLKELAQLGDSRERRLASLERFSEIRFSPEVSVKLMLEEIKHHYDARSRGEIAPAHALRNRLFPRSDLREIRATLSDLDEIVPEIRTLNERHAEFVNEYLKMRPFINELKQITHGKPWLEELSPEVLRLTSEDVEAARPKVQNPELAPLKAIYGRVKRERGRGAPLPNGFYEAVPSLAYLQLLDEPGIARRQIPEEDLEMAAAFYRLAIEELGIQRCESSFLTTPWSIVTDEMDPYACPGWNLWIAILRGLRSAGKNADASDPIDWEHLFHLPYVDLAFVDKRILGHLHDQSRRPGFGLTPDAVSHIHRAPNLEAVIREIQAHSRT
ncbi:MAG TPA: hypothetical protein VF647_09335 [Longimicrobium sp.]|jgi:hypothetical protein